MGKEIGIDLGTTNTVVSYVNKKGRLRPLKYEGKDVIPSVVYFLSANEFIIGEKARKKYIHNPQAGVANFKSHMGEKDKFEIVAENGDVFKYKAKKVASNFLNRIIANIETQLIKEFGPEDGCIGSVVITVPAKFNDSEKSATKWAAKEAGFENVKLAAEPTAAAVAHKQESGQEGKSILVYDFGGGTFDVSVIQENQRKFVEIATGGDKKLGGNKLTGMLAEYFFKLIEEEYGIDLPYDEEEFDEDYCGISRVDYLLNRATIIEEADNVKKNLSDEDSYEASVILKLPDGKKATWEYNISRDTFDDFIREDIERTVRITESVVQESCQKGIEGIDKIVLAGGSSQLPLVKELMEKHFNGSNPVFADDISTLISRGAAILANEELDDVTEPITNIQYGVAPTDGIAYRVFKTIIAEDQKLPCSAKEYFYLNKDGQERIEIPYFERDIKNYPHAVRTDDDGITEIDTIIISNLPKGLKKDEVKIAVEFTIERDGTLEIQINVIDANGESIRNLEVVCEKSSNLE